LAAQKDFLGPSLEDVELMWGNSAAVLHNPRVLRVSVAYEPASTGTTMHFMLARLPS